jgi:hypothetical protein
MRFGFMVLMLLTTGLCFAQLEKPHPQLTYGAITFIGDYDQHRSGCVQAPTEDGVMFESCPTESSLYEELGRLEKDDPHYEAKKALLIKMIDSVRKREG